MYSVLNVDWHLLNSKHTVKHVLKIFSFFCRGCKQQSYINTNTIYISVQDGNTFKQTFKTVLFIVKNKFEK